MTLEDYARAYTFRAATLTMARHISPRLGWRVRNPANSNSAQSPRHAGADRLSLSSVGATQFLDPFHTCAHTGEPA